MSQAVKIRSDVEVSCYAYEGIEAVKKALRAGLECSINDMPVKINLIAPPLYVVTTSTPERQEGIQLLQKAIARIEETIKGLGGSFNVQMAPKVVTALDDAQLASMLERLDLENQDVAGDSDDSEEDAGDENGEEEENDKDNEKEN